MRSITVSPSFDFLCLFFYLYPQAARPLPEIRFSSASAKAAVSRRPPAEHIRGNPFTSVDIGESRRLEAKARLCRATRVLRANARQKSAPIGLPLVTNTRTEIRFSPSVEARRNSAGCERKRASCESRRLEAGAGRRHASAERLRTSASRAYRRAHKMRLIQL